VLWSPAISNTSDGFDSYFFLPDAEPTLDSQNRVEYQHFLPTETFETPRLANDWFQFGDSGHIQRLPEGRHEAEGAEKSTSSTRPHHATEKKYRASLNDKFRALEATLLELKCARRSRRRSSPLGDPDNLLAQKEHAVGYLGSMEDYIANDRAELFELDPMRPRKQNKSQVLQDAIDHIRALEAQCKAKQAKILILSKATNAHSSRLSGTLFLMEHERNQLENIDSFEHPVNLEGGGLLAAMQ